MSHLSKILAYKEELSKREITCPVEQGKYIEGVFVRAIASYMANPTASVKDRDDHLYYMLDKWNSVTPFNGQYIFKRATKLNYEPIVKLQQVGTPNVELEVYLTDNSLEVLELVTYLKEEISKYRK